jgi:phosphoribosylaminoimidazole-succinocarboxamide synthase
LAFSLLNGHILKLAIQKDSREFVYDAVSRWKVDLIVVDSSGETVLDFVEKERVKAKGTLNEAVLAHYFEQLRKNGAKISREL